ncbi:methyltransferase [Maribius pontilimi]|uniref:Methyltransferase n=1 Tax=Palleronia pontilimi TaxID=1964209 RepID=A0A934M8F4_9RHOB|nr:methyltransferase [Palleronia pontilimi]MBJ3761342.1 methyltransferase [Palleronia pontilimi]
MTSDTDTTCDAFLGGRLTLRQPRRGYRAGVDPILLAASVDARPGQSVLELGCGVGAALFALATRVPSLDLTGVELQPAYADLARTNAAANKFSAKILTADLTDLPPDIRQRRFDHVIANPPYYRPQTGTSPAATDRAIAHREATPLAEWVATGARRLKPRGTLSVIQRADRLTDLLGAMDTHLGSITMTALHPRPGRAASLVIVKAIKGGRGALTLAPPLFMHRGDTHLSDGDDYTDAIRAVLRDAAALPTGP